MCRYWNKTNTEDNYPVYLYGVPLDNASLLSSYPSLLPSNITAGRNLQAGDSDVVVLEEHLANQFDVSVGGTFNILGKNFTVVGIEGQEALNATAHATMSLADLQALTNTAGQETTFKVFVDNVDNVRNSLSPNQQHIPDYASFSGSISGKLSPGNTNQH